MEVFLVHWKHEIKGIRNYKLHKGWQNLQNPQAKELGYQKVKITDLSTCPCDVSGDEHKKPKSRYEFCAVNYKPVTPDEKLVWFFLNYQKLDRF